MFGRIRRVAAISILATVLGPLQESRITLRATTYSSPVRPLSQDEWVERAVSSADGIVIGTIQSVNSIRTPVPNNPNFEHEAQYLIVRPERWLKGSSTEPLIRVNTAMSSDFTQPEYNPTEHFYFFLRRRVDRLTGSREWWLNSSPNPVLRGVGRMTAAMEGLPGEVSRAAARHNVKSLSTRADLIVLALPTGQGQDSHPFGKRGRCVRFRVVSDIAGTAPGDTVCVFAWIPGLEPYREALIFARRMSDGSYEILSAAAGSMEIEDGKVLRTGLPVTKQIAEIRDSLKIWKAIH